MRRLSLSNAAGSLADMLKAFLATCSSGASKCKIFAGHVCDAECVGAMSRYRNLVRRTTNGIASW